MSNQEESGDRIQHHRRPYTNVCNDIFADQDADWEHKGMLCYLFSLPNGWTVRMKHLQSVTQSGRERVARIYSELQGLGYIRRTKARNKLGQFIWTSHIFESLEMRSDDFIRITPSQSKADKPKKSAKSKAPSQIAIDGFSVDGSANHGKPRHLLTPNLATTNSERISSIKLNSLTGEPEKEKSANAESLISNSETSQPITPLETPLNPLDEGIHLQAREEGIQDILEGNQTVNHPSLDVDPDPSGEKDTAAARSINPDKSKDIFGKPLPVARQKVKAKSSSFLEIGIKNQRWHDEREFKEFRAYAIEWGRQRAEKATDGKTYDSTWLETVIYRTANCKDENSTDLTCWKSWCSEVPPPPLFVAPPEEEKKPLSQKTLDMIAAFKAQKQIDDEAREAKAAFYRCG